MIVRLGHRYGFLFLLCSSLVLLSGFVFLPTSIAYVMNWIVMSWRVFFGFLFLGVNAGV